MITRLLVSLATTAALAAPCYAAAAPTLETEFQPKPSFAQRHPKLHKVGRKIRRTCQVLLPVAEFAGALAQIGTFVR